MKWRLKKDKEAMKQSWLFENVKKTDKPLDKLTKERGRRPKLIKLEMKKGIHQQILIIFRVSLGKY
jgi:hypothetical protein